MKRKLPKIWLVIPFIVVSCSRPDHFIYHIIDPSPQIEKSTHLVKEIHEEGKVDILWVIDNSYSMSQWQREVIVNTGSFMDIFSQRSKLDWKMGLISTDEKNLPYVGFTSGEELDARSLNPVSLFRSAVSRLGLSGSGQEMMFRPVIKAFDTFPDFLRAGAHLAFIVITDAPEQSELPFIYFLNEVLRLKKGKLEKVITYGVLGALDLGCEASDDPWKYKNSEYEGLIVQTKGSVFPLCDPDFGKTLLTLGKDLVRRVVNPKIYLKERPVPSSIRLKHGQNEIKGGLEGYWYYDFDINAIVFHDLSFAAHDEEKIELTYEVLPTS